MKNKPVPNDPQPAILDRVRKTMRTLFDMDILLVRPASITQLVADHRLMTDVSDDDKVAYYDYAAVWSWQLYGEPPVSTKGRAATKVRKDKKLFGHRLILREALASFIKDGELDFTPGRHRYTGMFTRVRVPAEAPAPEPTPAIALATAAAQLSPAEMTTIEDHAVTTHTNERFRMRKIADLKRHPLNQKIYGKGPSSSLVESVKLFGVLTPILLAPDGEILAGHRRLDAAEAAGLGEVPTLTLAPEQVSSGEAKLMVLVSSNIQRRLDGEHVGRSAEALWEYHEKRAAERRRAG